MILAFLAVFSGAADAQEAPPTHEEQAIHDVSLTLSPLHLVFPILEMTGEYRASDRVGVALLAGAGQMTLPVTVDDDVTITVWEVGGQFRFYAIGNFDHGMQLGAELLWLGIFTDEIEGTEISGTGSGLALGPFLGYKIATDAGFTFDAQLGFQWHAVEARAEDADTGAEASEKETGINPLLNLNIGWSF